MPVGSTFTSNWTRDQLIEQAYRQINSLALGESLDADRQAQGVKLLNAIVRKLDAEKKHIWAISQIPSTLTLVANQFSYTTADTLPSNIKRLVAAEYRSSDGTDTPLEIITTEDFATIPDKFQIGDPRAIYLTEHRDVGSQRLYVWPTLGKVNTQSEVIGTDALNYRCIRSHTADSTNQPITGANYLLFWEQGGSSGSAWVTGTSYTAPQHLRLWFERPLFDFDSADDNPDVPQEWALALIYELSYHLSHAQGTPLEERLVLDREAQTQRKSIKIGQVAKSNNKFNKIKYF